MNPRPLSLILICVFLCAACGSYAVGPTITPTATAVVPVPPLPTLIPSATPTPEPALEVIEVSLLQDPQEGAWWVIGLLGNQADQALGEIELHLQARDGDGNLILDAPLPATFPTTPARGEAPFYFQLQLTDTPETIDIKPHSWIEVDFEAADLTVEINHSFSTGLREYALGEIRNPGSASVAIADLAVIHSEDGSGLSGFGHLLAGPSLLSPGEGAPFMIELLAKGADDTLKSFIMAETVAAPPAINLTISKAPEVHLDPQGNPFLIGEMANEEGKSAWLSALVGLKLDGDWVLVLDVNHPLPLEPGEKRSFTSTELPGLRNRLHKEELKPEDVEFETWIHHSRASSLAPAAAPLQLEVHLYEIVGSSIFIRGLVTNAGTLELYNPTVHATIFSTSGRLVSSDWHNPVAALLPGASEEFLLRLPLASEENPTTFEPHIWAAGLLEPPPPG